MTKIAILDDWQRIARQCADWSALEARAELAFFHEAFGDDEQVVAALADFDIVMAMRERTALPASVLRRLPKLKMLAMTGARAASIDLAYLVANGVTVSTSEGGGTGSATAELALGLMLAAVRRIPLGDTEIRAGRFQDNVPCGYELAGRTLGLVGLGRLGSRMAHYGKALGMEAIAWSQNLTAEAAKAQGAALVTKEELLARADVVSLHLVLSSRTRGIIGAADLARMKQGAVLINTSRGPLIDEAALIAALKANRIVAALDVYDREPLPPAHPLRTLPNTVLTPHVGYVVTEAMRNFYRQSVENMLAFLDGKPIRVLQLPKS
ncbi:MAG: D-2-hydroxyacid dehydrogenase family protein [Hyphomicrobiales bacterium]